MGVTIHCSSLNSKGNYSSLDYDEDDEEMAHGQIQKPSNDLYRGLFMVFLFGGAGREEFRGADHVTMLMSGL